MPATKSAREETQTPSKKPRRSRWKRRLFRVTLLLIVLAAAAPTIVGRTSLRNGVVRMIVPKFEGTITLGETQLGWFSPIRIDNLRIADKGTDTTTAAEVRRIETSHTLLDLILNPHALGTITITGLDLHVSCEPGETNVERLIESLGADSDNSSPAVEIVLLDSKVTMVDSRGDSPSKLSSERIVWQQTAAGRRTLDGVVQADSDAKEGRVFGKLALPETGETDWTGTLSAKDFPLETLQPLAARFDRPERLRGRWTGEWILTGKVADPSALFVSGHSEWTGLRIDEGTEKLLDVQSCRISLDGDSKQDGVHLRKLSAETDFGTAALVGEASLPPLDRMGDLKHLVDQLLLRPIELNAEVDMAKLAERFPGLLTLREGVRVTDGVFRMNLKSEPRPNTSQLVASATLKRLAAETAGRRLVWDVPFAADLKISKGPADDWTLDQLKIVSRAIAVSGQGTWAQARITANCDLHEFAREWGQLIDFGPSAPSGTLTAQIISRLQSNNRLELTGHADARNFSLGLPVDAPRRFDLLTFDGKAEGQLVSGRPAAWETAVIRLTTDKDVLTAQMIRETTGAAPAHVWQLHGTGTLESLNRQFGITSPGELIAGRFQVDAKLTVETTGYELAELDGQVDRFLWQGNGHRLDENKLIVKGGMRIDDEGGFTAEQLNFTCESVAARLQNVVYRPGTSGPTLNGTVAARGRIANLLRAWDPAGETLPAATGLVNLQLSAETDDRQSDVQWKLFTEDLRWIETPTRTPARPVSTNGANPVANAAQDITCDGKATIDRKAGRIDLSECRLDAGFLALTASGSIADLQNHPLVKLEGNCDYDWDVLSRRFPVLQSHGVHLAGRHQSPFRVTVPLNAADRQAASAMQGGFELRWDSARVASLDVGDARLAAAFRPGVIELEPATVRVATGAASFSPTIRFTERGAVIEQPKVKLLDSVALTEDICKSWLQYVSPLTADATRVQGTFSLDLTDTLRVPTFNTRNTRGQGVLEIARAEMRPGPMANQFLGLGRQIDALRRGIQAAPPQARNSKPIIVIDRQSVPFEIRKHRVFHRNLQMQIEGLNVSTQGSVGFDQSIDLVAVIEVPENWSAGGRRFRDVWGPAIRIPIRGRLGRPQIDGRVIQTLLGQFLGGGVNNLIEKGLNRQLEKLFRPK